MPTDYQIAITRPCRDAPGRFTAESTYGRRLDMAAICLATKSFPEAKCSESLGVAKFDYGEHTVILYRSGRIDLRRVKDVADARAVMAELEQTLAGAFEPEDNVHQNVQV